MHRTLITGGAGFLGSHLCDYLLNKDHEVICMDNLLTGSLLNIEHIKNDRFNFIEHNVTNFIDIEGPLDFILHFASPASPIDYLEFPIPTLKVGSLGTHNALGLAKKKKSVFLIASTSEVYGDPLVHPQREDYWGNVNPVGLEEYTMRQNALQKRLQWLTTAITISIPKLLEFLIRMAPACALTMEGQYQILSNKR